MRKWDWLNLDVGSFQCITSLSKRSLISVGTFQCEETYSEMSYIKAYWVWESLISMISGLSRKFTKTGVNDTVYELIANYGLRFAFCSGQEFHWTHTIPAVYCKTYLLPLWQCSPRKFRRWRRPWKLSLMYVCICLCVCVCTCACVYACMSPVCWSVDKKGYFGMTRHYEDEGLNRTSMTQAYSKLSGSHTFDVLAQIIQNKLKEYCIHNKCVSVVTDSGSNM